MKRFLALLLAAMMLSLTFAGCGEKPETPAEPSLPYHCPAIEKLGEQTDLFFTDWGPGEHRGEMDCYFYTVLRLLTGLSPDEFEKACGPLLVEDETGAPCVPASLVEGHLCRFFDISRDELRDWIWYYDEALDAYPVPQSVTGVSGNQVRILSETKQSGTRTVTMEFRDADYGILCGTSVITCRETEDGYQMIACRHETNENYMDELMEAMPHGEPTAAERLAAEPDLPAGWDPASQDWGRLVTGDFCPKASEGGNLLCFARDIHSFYEYYYPQGLTKAAEELTPKEAVQLMSFCFRACDSKMLPENVRWDGYRGGEFYATREQMTNALQALLQLSREEAETVCRAAQETGDFRYDENLILYATGKPSAAAQWILTEVVYDKETAVLTVSADRYDGPWDLEIPEPHITTPEEAYELGPITPVTVRVLVRPDHSVAYFYPAA